MEIETAVLKFQINCTFLVDPDYCCMCCNIFFKENPQKTVVSVRVRVYADCSVVSFIFFVNDQYDAEEVLSANGLKASEPRIPSTCEDN